MKKSTLMKTQQDQVSEVIRRAQLELSEFTWTEVVEERLPMTADEGIISILTHTPTGYSFSFDLRNNRFFASFSPGDTSPEQFENCKMWDGMLYQVKTWLTYLRREILAGAAGSPPIGIVSQLDPWRVICSFLIELPDREIPGIIDRSGLKVDWNLTEKEDYSAGTRKAAYRPRINSAYDALSEEERLRVAYVAASQLAQRDLGEGLNGALQQIGWQVESNRLVPTTQTVRELFFPKGSQHDAYVEIRTLIQRAKGSIAIVDPYLDGSVFTLLATISSSGASVQLLTYWVPSDFAAEANKFLAQHRKFVVEVRRSMEFHDRFIILDGNECWHIGCSIKDAGSKAFMLSQIEDDQNRKLLIKQQQDSWSKASPFPI